MLKDIRSITPHVSVNSASSNAVSRAPPSLVENNVDSREYQRRSSSGACGGSESDALLETQDIEINVFASQPLSRKYIESRSLWNDITYHTVRGFESCLIYTWIAKDLCWTLYSSDPVWEVAAGTAFGFGVLVMLRSIIDFELEDAWHRIAEFLWVFANFLWMSADIHDFYETDEEEISSVRYPQAAHILEATMCWLAIYYFFIKPLNIKLAANSESSMMYDGTGLVPRFSYFENWRQYENVHVVWWIGKDYAWLTENKVMWVIFVIPTVLIAVDFVICTGRTKRLMIDHCYYISQLLWVLANITWAYGELFLPEELDEPRSPWEFDDYTESSMRWYSCWFLILAYLPLVFLLCCWLPLMVWAYQTKDGRDFMGNTTPPASYEPGPYVAKEEDDDERE